MAHAQMVRTCVFVCVWFSAAPLDSDCEGGDCSSGPTPPSPPTSSSPFLEMKSSHLSQEFLDQFVQVNSSNSGERKHRDAGAVMPFVGLTRSADLSRSCCKNGGTCFLGSFCICPPFFTGRNCDYDTRIRRCDFIPHGEWVQKGCSYCRCMYGVLHCVPHVFHKDCDDSEEEVRWNRSSAVSMNPLAHFLFFTFSLPVSLLLTHVFT
ncbi:teratocarcinoma-derived growth factor 1 [Nothobranchius furzeri]|uniref:Cryptic protein-like n=3 Tax=Nothobranchius furzeri TaxID=105023 RepID=A0A9D3BRV3_NOTFU|nr:cryptic protein-like [Nothobranchius furzeri]